MNHRTLPLDCASRIARQVSLTISSACERVCVVGAVRRQERRISEIEILACGPRTSFMTAVGRCGIRRRGDLPLWAKECEVVLNGMYCDPGEVEPIVVGTSILDAHGRHVLPCLLVHVNTGQFGIFTLAETGPESYCEQLKLHHLRPGVEFRGGWIWADQQRVKAERESDVQPFLSVDLVAPNLRAAAAAVATRTVAYRRINGFSIFER